MADMTHKHHNLIYDAIEASAQKVLESKAMTDIMDGTGQNQFLVRCLYTSMVNHLANEFSTRLRYTNDKFEALTWSQQVKAIADECWKRQYKTSR